MKLCALFIFGVLAISLPLQSLDAQITLTRADAEAIFSSQSLHNFSAQGVETTQFALGSVGTGKMYDLTSYTYQKLSTNTSYVSPGTTPYASDFPTATHAQTSSNQGVQYYSFFRLSDEGLYLLGGAGEQGGQLMMTKKSPEEPSMLFPTTFGRSWSYVGDPYSPATGVSIQERFTITVDAAGTLKIAEGEFPCLRLKNVKQTSTKIEFGGQVLSETVATTVNYQFMTKTGYSAYMSIDTLDENSENPKLESLSYSVYSQTPTNAESPVTGESTFGIASNYPNPVTSTTERADVSWNQNESGASQLQIFDLNGRNVRTIWVGASSTGKNTLSWSTHGLNNGMYMLRLNVNGRLSTRMFVVSR